MEWRGRRGSRNVEDRRGMTGGAVGGLGLVGTLVVLAVGWFFGIDISGLVGAFNGSSNAPVSQGQLSEQDQQAGEFVSVVLADTEEVWTKVLREQQNLAYVEPKLVLFRGAVQSACGGASAAMGPFYCPGDQKVYLDTAFFGTLQNRMGAKGNFAAAYVIAHEIGHHVQNLIGILPEVSKMRARASEADSNTLSVLTELQADCFAGIWSRQASEQFGTITEADFKDALTAAAAVGDDTLQEAAGQAVVPDNFTHGSSADRQQWFLRGLQSGELAQCNTFAEAGL